MKFLYKKTFFIFPFLTSIYLQAQEKPNLVFIMADQWRGDALGCLGKEPVKTPCLDQLAREGVNFTNAVSSYPVSSPARGMLMTGMYPHKNKVTGNCNSANAPYGVELPQDARCWSDILKANGYQTGYIGKWHLDAPHEPYIDTYNNHGTVAWNEWCPKERRHGFDYWTAYGTYDYHLKPMYWDTDAPRDSFYYVNQWGPEYEADKAIEYLNGHIDKTQPFALVVSMNPPHTGYELVPDRYKEMYKNLNVEALCANRPDIPAKGTEMGDYFRNNIRNYYACMTGVDENIGRIINELKRLGLFKNTIVVFTSDHGICMGAHEQAGKDIFYEESMRIPVLISWPEKIKPKTDRTTMIAFADLYPTLLSIKPHQLKWHEAEMGAVFHYDLHVFDGIRYGQGNNRISPIEDYNIFNPTQLDTDQWIQAAKAAGCKFAVLTATHETGFGLWQSDVNPYCLKAVKWRDGKGDIVRDFVNSCRKYGIQPGIYVGIRWNSLLGIHNFKVAGDGEFAANRQAWYKRFCEKMVEELCTRYGDLYMIWFDGKQGRIQVGKSYHGCSVGFRLYFFRP
jgi:arylsulfatase A-like enzyme